MPGRRSGRLSNGERELLDALITPVLNDIRDSGALLPDLSTYRALDCSAFTAFSMWGGVDGRGKWVLAGMPYAEQLVEIAQQLQETEMEALYSAGRSTAWPPCPIHSREHSLKAAIDDRGEAAWWCWRSRVVVCAIGDLNKGVYE